MKNILGKGCILKTFFNNVVGNTEDLHGHESGIGSNLPANITARDEIEFRSFYNPDEHQSCELSEEEMKVDQIDKRLKEYEKILEINHILIKSEKHFGAPWRPFWIWQAVRRCRRLASAPFAARLVFDSVLFSIIIIWTSK